MEDEKKQTVELTAEELTAFKAYQAAKAKEEAAAKRKADRVAYAELVDEVVAKAIPELQALSEQIVATKRKVYAAFAEVLQMKDGIMKLTKAGQRTHTFTHSNGRYRLTLGYNSIDGYRDTVEDGIALVKQYIESLATDAKSRTLVAAIMQLLSRDQAGNVKASRVLQLRKLAEQSNSDVFKEGVEIIEESYQPSMTKQFIRGEYRDDQGGWHYIPLSVTDAELREPEGKKEETANN